MCEEERKKSRIFAALIRRLSLQYRAYPIDQYFAFLPADFRETNRLLSVKLQGDLSNKDRYYRKKT